MQCLSFHGETTRTEGLVNCCLVFPPTHAGGGDVDLVTYRLQNGEDQTTAKRFNKKLLARLRENLGQEVRW